MGTIMLPASCLVTGVADVSPLATKSQTTQGKFGQDNLDQASWRRKHLVPIRQLPLACVL